MEWPIKGTVAAFLMCSVAECTQHQDHRASLGASSAKSASSHAGAAAPLGASAGTRPAIADFVTRHGRRRGSIAFQDHETICALGGNGRVVCWGAVDVARPGVSRGDHREPLPALLPGVRDATWIDAVGNRFCVVASQDGRVLCWGEHARDTGAPKWNAVDLKPTRIAGSITRRESYSARTSARAGRTTRGTHGEGRIIASSVRTALCGVGETTSTAKWGMQGLRTSRAP